MPDPADAGLVVVADADVDNAPDAPPPVQDTNAFDIADNAGDFNTTGELAPAADTFPDIELPKEKKPYGVCDDGLQLPHAGSACSDEGKVHCSRIGEEPNYLFNGLAGSHQICQRPYQLVCTKTSAAGLTWQLSACPAPSAACAALGVHAQTCQENSRGAHCASIEVKFEGQEHYFMCNPGDVGKRWCVFGAPISSSGGIVRCDYPDAVLTNLGSEEQKNKSFQNACAASSQDCLYIFADECPNILKGVCNNCMEWPCEGTGQYCLPNLPNKPNPSCVENCEEFKFTKDYKPK